MFNFVFLDRDPSIVSGPDGVPKGPPEGFGRVTQVTEELGQAAKAFLAQDFGARALFYSAGKQFMARVEPHFHPEGYVGGPTGWHKGVTLYENLSASTPPSPLAPVVVVLAFVAALVAMNRFA